MNWQAWNKLCDSDSHEGKEVTGMRQGLPLDTVRDDNNDGGKLQYPCACLDNASHTLSSSNVLTSCVK